MNYSTTGNPVEVPNQLPGLPGNQRGRHMNTPPRRSVDVLTTRYFDLVGQPDGHRMSGTVVGCDSNDDPGRGCHWDGVVVTVRSKLVWDGDDRLVSGTVTLSEGQIHGKLHRLIGGKFLGSVLSLEIRLNLLGGDISGITRGGLLVASGRRRGDSARRLSFSGDVG